MSTISKFNAALGTAVNENTLALASFNFDFSLFKVEAPIEYQGLGASLADHRREQAEKGTPHRTARKLGALFEQVLPRTPNLLKAYGTRVSEISQSPSTNPKGRSNAGVFAAHMGADGTAIWAAATSGPSALPVLLLACMLARIWKAPEATSLWVELVAHRQKEIQTSCDGSEGIHLVAIQAAQQELTRSQLADWDASARAWLQTADQAKAKQQKQLMLIINNLSLPVNNKMHVYESVMDGLRSALVFVEDLLKGMHQRVGNGAVLLGLSSWHLYPDFIVHQPTEKKIQQHDPLLPLGIVVSLGLESEDGAGRGVCWSLPLAHLRYYGDSVMSSRSTGYDASRVSLEQFLCVVLGSVLHGWPNSSDNLKIIMEWFEEIGNFLQRSAANPNSAASMDSAMHARFLLGSPNWLSILIHTAVKFLGLSTSEQEEWSRLIALGRRRYPLLLSRNQTSPFFGLSHPEVFCTVLKGGEEKVAFLRRVAADIAVHYDLGDSDMIIRYTMEDNVHTESQTNTLHEYASALPLKKAFHKRDNTASRLLARPHRRWIALPWKNKDLDSTRNAQCYCRYRCRISCSCSSSTDVAERSAAIQRLDEDCTTEEPQWWVDKVTGVEPFKTADWVEQRAQELYLSTWLGSSESPDWFTLKDAPWDESAQSGHSTANLSLIFGTSQSYGLFLVQTTVKADQPLLNAKDKVDIALLTKSVREDTLDANLLLKHLTSLQNGPDKRYYHSLKAITAMAEIYKLLPDATIALDAASRPFHESLWTKTRIVLKSESQLQYSSTSRRSDWCSPLTRAGAFACIAMMESGHLDISPDQLDNVFAMSSGNSIYVAAPLLCDPCEIPRISEIRRIVGNIGRAGIAMMISPQDTRIRKLAPETWELINHSKFDGKLEDCFLDTSLHLSFTQYVMPIDLGRHGAQDVESYFIETLVSVYDRGQWVADLDVLATYESGLLKRQVMEACHEGMIPCQHFGATKCAPEDHQSNLPGRSLIALDNWEEILDREADEESVVRAHGNWLARLATAAVSIKQSYPTVILPDEICWGCIMHPAESSKLDKGTTYIL